VVTPIVKQLLALIFCVTATAPLPTFLQIFWQQPLRRCVSE
jgi:hypothetical protein